MLEPDAAHWGRWAEAGMMAVNEEDYPIFDQNCAEGRNNARCRLFYLQPNEAGDVDSKLQEYIGTLYPYVFADAESQDNITQGPRKLAQKAIDRGDFRRVHGEEALELFHAAGTIGLGSRSDQCFGQRLCQRQLQF